MDRVRADRNVVAALEHFGRRGAGARLSRREGLLLIESATDFAGAFHNAVFREQHDVEPGRVVEETRRFARRKQRDIVLWADDILASEAGRQGLESRPAALGMFLRAAPPGNDAGQSLTWVADHAGVDAFAAVHREVFADGGRDPQATSHFASPEVLLAPGVDAVVASVDGVPASCAMSIRGDRLAGIYWVATTPAMRNRGLGALVTAAVARKAFEHGSENVVLQATALGAPVYRRLGFTPFAEYQRYVVPHH